MRTILWAPALALAVAAAPAVAQAGFVVEGSLGKGLQVQPSVDHELGPTNLEVAPGVTLLGEVLRLELGLVVDLPHEGVGTNLRLRPMLVFDPPILPLYARLIVGVSNLVEGDRQFEYGGAIGIGGSIAGVGLFAEVGVIPQSANGKTATILEGRAGGFVAF